MIACLIGTALGDPAVVSHDDSFSKEGLFKADVATLKDTQLALHPDVPLALDKNVLWCGTMQLAWNKATDLVGEKLRFENQPPVVDLLNRQDFTDADLDPASYVALADFEKNNVEDEIRAALERTFGGAASPELIPEKPTNPGRSDFVAYAYLYKNLVFAHPFKVLDPLTFGSTKVENFGFDLDEYNDDILGQVGIYDYKSENDFILKLKTKSPDDELILAKVTPGTTLEETMTQVLGRLAHNAPYTSHGRDQLFIPKLNFDLRRDFPELENLILQPSAAAKIHPDPPLYLKKAEQLVRFQLNEKGANLKSEAAIEIAGGGDAPSPPSLVMIFDKPFLILMKRAKSDHPYFALWVGNASLLEPALANAGNAKPANPELAVFYCDRGNTYQATGQYDKALADFNEAIRINPKFADAYYSRANAYATKGDSDKSIADFSQLIQIDPSYDMIAYKSRAMLYSQKGDYDKALAYYNHIIESLSKIKGTDGTIRLSDIISKDKSEELVSYLKSDAYDNRGTVYHAKGDYKKALADFAQAIEIDPTNPTPYNVRGWLLATSPLSGLRDGKQAVEDATKACNLSRRTEPHFVDTLAAAYAEAGDFDSAAKWEQYYLTLPNLTPSGIEDGEKHLKLFQAHKPYHTDKLIIPSLEDD